MRYFGISRKNARERMGFLFVPVLFSAVSFCLSGCGMGVQEPSLSEGRLGHGMAGRQIPGNLPSIPAGTNLSVRLLQSINDGAASGQRFEAELTAPVFVSGSMAFPRSSRVQGHVRNNVPPAGDREGYLQLTLDSIQALDGHWIGIDTTHISVRKRIATGPGFMASFPPQRFSALNTGHKLIFATLQEIASR
jgi:hypothetical protein